MDRLLENSFMTPDVYQQGNLLSLPLDVTENENEYVIKASMPGVNPDDIDITVNGNTINIRGETKSESEQQDENQTYHLRERRFGSFARSVTLPTSIDANKIKAHTENGVLTLEVPKAEEAKPKRIQVQGGGHQKTIEAKNK
jgi:HSP20 family protein